MATKTASAAPARSRRSSAASDTRRVGRRQLKPEQINSQFTQGGPHRARAAKPAPPTADGRMKVRAVETGFYRNKRRREGDVFVIANSREFSSRWMEPVDPATPARTTTGAEHLKRKHDEHLAATEGGRRTAPARQGGDDDEDGLFE